MKAVSKHYVKFTGFEARSTSGHIMSFNMAVCGVSPFRPVMRDAYGREIATKQITRYGYDLRAQFRRAWLGRMKHKR